MPIGSARNCFLLERLRAIRASPAQIRAYEPSPQPDRALAFMLDVANQYGDGGARRIFQAVN